MFSLSSRSLVPLTLILAFPLAAAGTVARAVSPHGIDAASSRLETAAVAEPTPASLGIPEYGLNADERDEMASLILRKQAGPITRDESTRLSRLIEQSGEPAPAGPDLINGAGYAFSAASGNSSPDLINAGTYVFSNSTGAVLEDMSSGTTLLLAADQDDSASGIAPIGFDFWFDGTRQTLFSASANGLMRLGVTAVSTAFTNDLASATNVPQIAPYWDDLWLGNNGKIHFKVVGSAPTRKLVVEWQNEQIPRVSTAAPGTSGAGTFQAWLYESTGVIEFVYGSGVAINTTNSGASIGIGSSAVSFASVTASASPSVAYGIANNVNTAAIASGTKYTFTPGIPVAPGALSFTAVGLNTMTLNWADTNAAEFGYGIYRSLDGVNYDFIRQTAANATTSVEAGLASNTTWFWRVVAVTEGGVSAPSAGSQATPAGTVAGTRTVGPTGTYLTIGAAVTDINTNGLSGNVILELQNTYLSTVETFPLVVGSLGSPLNTITIRPQAGATALSITSANTTATLDLNPATNVIIDGRAGGAGPSQLTIANTATAGVAVRFINGASRNIVQFATIQGVNTAATGGVVLFSTSAGVTGNNNNSIDNCSVRDGATTPVNGILSLGTAATTLLNTSNTISNNTIFNFHSATVASNGISVSSNSTAWTISNNRVFQTAPRASTAAITHRGILVAPTNGFGFIVSGNVVGFANAAGTGTYTMTSIAATGFVGIQLQHGLSLPSSIQNNTVAGISITTTTGTLTGISLSGGSANIAGNTVGSGTGNGSLTSTPTGAAFILGMSVSGATTGTVVVSGNTIGSLTATGSPSTINPNMNVVQVTGGALTITGNSIGSATTANSIQTTTTGTAATNQQILGMLIAGTMPCAISGNTVANITNAGTGTAHVAVGIGYQGTGTATISSNIIHDIAGANANGTIFGGVRGINHVGAAPYGASIDRNTVFAISATNPGAVTNTAVGIVYTNPAIGTVTRNRVYDIRNASTGTTVTAPPSAVGILALATGASGATLSNNMISLGDSQSTNTQFVGIMNGFSTLTLDCSYNSVHIAGTAAAGALPSYGFLRGDNSAASAIATAVTLRNNIFNNTRTGGTGKHYAIGNANSVPATGWAAGASNNNVLNSATASTVGLWGLALDQTFVQWQGSSAGDGASLSGVTVPFVAPAAADLHLVSCSALVGAGTPVGGITVDYDNDPRSATNPDIGADEGSAGPGFTITASAGAGGNIAPSGSVPVGCNGSKSFAITPGGCYAVADVLVDGVSVGAVTNYTFTNVMAAHTIAASFTTVASYTITATAGANGSISPSGAVPVTCTGNQLFTLTPAAGFTVQDLLVDGASVGAPPAYNFLNVTAPHTIAASFRGNLGSVPDRLSLGTPLTIAKNGVTPSHLNLSWGDSCGAAQTDFAVYEGVLGTWYSHASRLCSTAGAFTATDLTPAAGNAYYLIVPLSPTAEGSYGANSLGAEIPQGTGTCFVPSDTTACN